MHYPTDEFGADVPVFVLTPDGNIVPADSPEGRRGVEALERLASIQTEPVDAHSLLNTVGPVMAVLLDLGAG